MVTRHDRRMLRVALVSFCLASTEGLCLLGERHTPKRHRQRQHQRRDQQRNALFHLLTSSRFLQEQTPKQKQNRPASFLRGSRLRYWLRSSLKRPSLGANFYTATASGFVLFLRENVNKNSVPTQEDEGAGGRRRLEEAVGVRWTSWGEARG
jgi:hypothetical protein